MMARHDNGADEADLEALRELYASLGPGYPLEVARVFAGDGSATSEQWDARTRRGRGPFVVPQRWRRVAGDDLSSGSLFLLPPGWELTRAELSELQGELTRRGDLLSAEGTFYCRLRGGWHTDPLPFLHLWTMCAGRALRFESYLEGLELRRAGRLEGCPARF
ncbi:MAG TPA: hypothetical protein VK576_02775 [Thermoleophilia bacterium]|nr:hypothetical protein [Thermoleophilia bacterium]